MFGAGMGTIGSLGFNEAMAGVALNQVANQMQASGLTSWFPTIFLSLQQLFNVGHSYVFRKLLLLMCPFLKRQQGSPTTTAWGGQLGGSSSSQSGSTGPDGLKADIEDPDLYIPLMSYVTYVLLYGMQRGILKDFRPDVLPSTASFALVLLVIEVGAAKMAFYLAGSAMPFLHLAANCGYKFLPVMMMVLSRIIIGSSPIYWVVFAYFAACAAWAARRFLLHFEPAQQQYSTPSALHGHIILVIAASQVLLCWLLTPSIRSPVAAPLP